MGAITYHKTAERPDIKLWLLDDTGALIDFSSGYTFAFKLGKVGSAADFTKTTGITGAAGSGSSPDGTPNVTVSFTAGELDNLAAGPYGWQLRATSGGLDRIYSGAFVLKDVIT
jgi:hypothetical protein